MSVLVNNTNGTSSDYLVKTSMAGSPNLQASYTITMRIRFNTLGTSDEYGAVWRANANASGAYCGRQAGETAGRWSMYRSNSLGTTVNECVTTGYVADGATRHFAATYDGTNIRSYINGVLQNTTASTNTLVTSTTNTDLRLAWGGRFVMTDVGIFSRVLTADELLFLTANRLAPVLSKGDCFGFYPLHADNILKDYSGFGNDMSAAAGTGNAPVADNENPPTPWARSSARIFLPLAVTVNLIGSGETVAAGSSTQTKAASVIGTSLTRAAGAATDTKAASVVAAGASRTAGTSTQSKAFALTAAGATRTAGTATDTKTASIVGTSETVAAGVATVAKTASTVGTGLTRTAGTGVDTKLSNLTSTGLTRTSGVATDTKSVAAIATSLTRTAGAGTVTQAGSATGATKTAGAATVSKTAAVFTAAANTITRGLATLAPMQITGTSSTRTGGVATTATGASLTVTCLTRTAGSATLSGVAPSSTTRRDDELRRRHLHTSGRRRTR